MVLELQEITVHLGNEMINTLKKILFKVLYIKFPIAGR